MPGQAEQEGHTRPKMSKQRWETKLEEGLRVYWILLGEGLLEDNMRHL